MSNLSGKTALVTGASRGIGRASALALAKAGAQVLVHYSSRGKEAEAVVAEIRQAGGRAEGVAADLRAPNGPHALAKLVHGIVGSRVGTRRARHPRQRRRTRRRRNRYVQLCQDRVRLQPHSGHASPEACRPAGRHRRSRRLPRLRRGPLDHRRHGPGRRRLETLKPQSGEPRVLTPRRSPLKRPPGEPRCYGPMPGSNIGRNSDSPWKPGQYFRCNSMNSVAISIASAFESVFRIAQPPMTSLVSENGPSVTVILPLASRTRMPSLLGSRPPVSTRVPFLSDFSTNLPIASIKAGGGGDSRYDSEWRMNVRNFMAPPRGPIMRRTRQGRIDMPEILFLCGGGARVPASSGSATPRRSRPPALLEK